MASETEVKLPLSHINTYVLMYRIHGRWLLRFYTDLPSAIAEKDRIKRIPRNSGRPHRVYIAWILV